MPQYKILAQVLLMLSVINFALAAPVVSQDHEVRVSAANTANDGPYTNNPLSGLGLRGFLSSPRGAEPMSTATHNTPPADVSPHIEPPPDSPPSSPSFDSWLPPDSHTTSPESSWTWSSGSGFESASDSEHSDSLGGSSPYQHHPSKLQDLASTAESLPPSPPPPSRPGLSGRPPLPPSAIEMNKAARILTAMRQGLRPRTYDSGAVDAAKGE
jgi:hypothetical protein